MRKLLFMYPELKSLVLLSVIWHIHRKVWLFVDIRNTRNVLSYRRYLCCLQWLENLSRKMKSKTRENLRAMIIEFNQSCRFLTDEFKGGRPKSVVVPEDINAVRKMIVQDSHVTYREISMTSIQKNLVHVGFHIIWQWIKKDSCRLVQRNAHQIQSCCVKSV